MREPDRIVIVKGIFATLCGVFLSTYSCSRVDVVEGAIGFALGAAMTVGGLHLFVAGMVGFRRKL